MLSVHEFNFTKVLESTSGSLTVIAMGLINFFMTGPKPWKIRCRKWC